MTFTEIQQLAAMGFTPADIMELTRTTGSEPAAPAAAPAAPADGEQEQEPETAATPETQETPAPQQDSGNSDELSERLSGIMSDAFDKRLSGIEKAMADITKQIQHANLRNDSFASPSETLEQKTDAIMAAIIRPDTNRKDDEK